MNEKIIKDLTKEIPVAACMCGSFVIIAFSDSVYFIREATLEPFGQLTPEEQATQKNIREEKRARVAKIFDGEPPYDHR